MRKCVKQNGFIFGEKITHNNIWLNERALSKI